ncbi:hypothetical protein GQ53DRAFT_272189 [Thozetella sp. PMI_491]|nr:hypothetical protein GQ53DRAFT_272189 [Thozetella sp. PMI_491]
MLALYVLQLASVAAAGTLVKRRPGPPVDCVPYACGKDAVVVCQKVGQDDRDTSQFCATPDARSPTGYSSTATDWMSRVCSNSTYSPTYPLKTPCDETLAPYDPSKLPDNCMQTMCANLDGSPMSIWCLYHPENSTGMEWERVKMACP